MTPTRAYVCVCLYVYYMCVLVHVDVVVDVGVGGGGGGCFGVVFVVDDELNRTGEMYSPI